MGQSVARFGLKQFGMGAVVVILGLLSGCGSQEGGQTKKPAADAVKSGDTGAASTPAATPAVDLSGLSGSISVNGSSTLEPVSEAVAEEFQNATKRSVKVKVGIAGTGGGFKKFCRDELDICDASRPILKEEMEAAREKGIEYIELPVCFDALTVAVHPSNKLTSITVAQLKTMWEPAAEKKITRWKQVNPDWPDAELTLFGAGLDSGTFDYFTEAIN